jgi:ferredoxin-NADP reductase
LDAIPVVERNFVLTEKMDETPEVLIIGFKPEDDMPTAFDPGMFMMISGIDNTTGQKHTARAFSIASDPSSPDMEFFVIKNPTHGDHIGKSHFVDAQVNDRFTLKGPSGQFRFDPTSDPKVLFIAGGTGLAPFMSMLRHMKAVGAKNDAYMLYSVKFPNEIIRKTELDSYAQQLGLKLIPTVTRPVDGDGWTGQTGHIDSAMIQKQCPDFSERMCYICGPLAFVKAVKDALAALNVQPARISADVWG